MAEVHNHKVVSSSEWVAARKSLLTKEKEFTKLRDELNRQRRELPWEKVEKSYAFDSPNGKENLSDLFENRSQLAVYHFMFAPNQDAGCPHCSFWADHYSGMLPHLNHRDVTFVVISRAPIEKINSFKKRMGWTFKWVSSGGTDFNYDLGVSFMPEQLKDGSGMYNYEKLDSNFADREGLSVFYKDERGTIFHTYSTYARGIDMINGTYQILDLVPKGRDEEKLEFTQAWVRHHDRYDR